MLSNNMMSIGVFCMTLGLTTMYFGGTISPELLAIAGAAFFIVSFILLFVEHKLGVKQ